MKDKIRNILKNQAGVGEDCQSRISIELAVNAIHNAVREEYLKKYEYLTPNGSEFINNPQRVYEYIKERLNSAGEAKKEVVRLKRRLADFHKEE